MPPTAEKPEIPESEPSPRRAWTFVAWIFAIAWPAAALMWILLPSASRDDVGRSLIGAILIVVPVLVTVGLQRRSGGRFRDWGLRTPPVTTLLLAPLVSLALVVLATTVPVLIGISQFDPSGAGEVERLASERRTEALELKLDIDEYGSPLRGRIVVGLITGTVLGLILAPVVELPWRGLLLTELSARGYLKAVLASSALAALWWLPLQLQVDLVAGGAPFGIVRLLSYALICVPLSWLRTQTDSILPGSMLLVTAVALSHIPALALRGGDRLQIQLCALAVVGVIAGLALIFPPRVGMEAPQTETTAPRN